MSKIVTQENFEYRLAHINPTIEVLGKYVAAKKSIHCRCRVCGFEWDPTPSNLLKGRKCQKCSGKYHMSHDEFVKAIAISNPDLEILGEFIDQHTRIKVRCKKCGKIWNPISQSILVGYGCKDCGYIRAAQKMSLPVETVVERFHNLQPDIELLDDYVDAKTPVKCRCLVCGYTWPKSGVSIRNGTGCPLCTHQLSRTQQEFVEEMATISPTIKILSEFKKRKTIIKCKCLVCDYEWTSVANNLLIGEGCKACADKKRDERNLALRKPHKVFLEELGRINPYIELLSKYENATTKVLCKCRHCGNVWKAAPFKLIAGQSCPECSPSSTSFMEQMICEAFKYALGEDKVFSRDKSAIGLELDIYIPSLSLAIEPGSWFWHKDKLENDEKKRNACKRAGIKLITIYDDFDESTKPFIDDCFTFRAELGQEKNNSTLKQLISKLLTDYCLNVPNCVDDWNEIIDRAYIKSRKTNTEQFKTSLAEINPSIEVLGEYKRSSLPILCRCKLCGNEWNPTPGALLQGHGCKCRRNNI